MKYPGFIYESSHDDRRILFMKGHGKDFWDNNCYRIALYYNPEFAVVHIETTEKSYNAFLVAHKAECYSEYAEFVSDWDNR